MTTDPDGAARVPVALGDRSYDILVGPGLLAEADRHVGPLAAGRRIVVVTDETVAGLHLDPLMAALARGGIAADALAVPPGEASKGFARVGELLDRMLDLRIDRGTMVLALGGGVIGDLAGFAAAIALRGIDFIQAPTTLLAQVDSSVGGKTGVNARQGKNLIGAFHQPRLVLADIAALRSLPRRELLAGYAEVAKYGLIDRPAFFDWLEGNAPRLLDGDDAALTQAVVESCRAKADVVARDERETGDRALLNLGHTFAHAFEVEAGYDGQLLHGEAVSIGMRLAFDLSVRLGLCPASDAERVRAHLAGVGLPVDAPHLNTPSPPDAERLLSRMRQDKKARGGKLTLILARGIGQSFIMRDAEEGPVRALLADALAA